MIKKKKTSKIELNERWEKMTNNFQITINYSFTMELVLLGLWTCGGKGEQKYIIINQPN